MSRSNSASPLLLRLIEQREAFGLEFRDGDRRFIEPFDRSPTKSSNKKQGRGSITG
jgi:hypothetical protein